MAVSGRGGTPEFAPDHNRSKFTTTQQGGKRLSELQLPWFTVFPPRGFGVLTTSGRRTRQPRRTCIRAVRDGNTALVVAIAGERTSGRPKLSRIRRMHQHWFRTGTPIAIDLR